MKSEESRGRWITQALRRSRNSKALADKHFRRDISVVVSGANNLRVLSVDDGAAVENVEDVLYLRNIDMVLTTQEAMDYLKTSGELGPNLDQRLTYIAPLFPNPLQILARSGAKSISDLNGKKVSFNNKGSATAQFVPKIFKTLGINVEELYLSQGDARSV